MEDQILHLVSVPWTCMRASKSAHTHYCVTCPPPTLPKRVFCQRACAHAHLLIHSEAESRNRQQATAVQIIHAAYFLAQLQSTQSGLQAGWMVLVAATFNHHSPRAILSPSSFTLQVLRFRGSQHCSSSCASRLCTSIMNVIEICVKVSGPKIRA